MVISFACILALALDILKQRYTIAVQRNKNKHDKRRKIRLIEIRKATLCIVNSILLIAGI